MEPTPHPMVTDPPPANSTVMPAPRKKLDSEFNDEENKLEMADTQAEIILSQGLPRHIFNILNQTSTAKEIWDNVEIAYARIIGFPKAVSPSNHQASGFLPNSRTHAYGALMVTLFTETNQRKAPDKALLMEAKGERNVLEAEAEAFHLMMPPRYPVTCLGYMAKRAQSCFVLMADTLLHPTHHPVSIWDSEEVLVHQIVSMKKMSEKPGHVRPANGFYDKLNALKFVPQQELSREQAYWLSCQ
ncbi:hypothetical protein Tco_1035924 [Tanacetum coccineum]